MIPGSDRTIEELLKEIAAAEQEHKLLKARRDEATREEQSMSCRLSNLRIAFTKKAAAAQLLDPNSLPEAWWPHRMTVEG